MVFPGSCTTRQRRRIVAQKLAVAGKEYENIRPGS